MPASPAGQLSTALDITGGLIASVRGEQWAEPTPCTAWTVRDLVSHLVIGNAGFARALTDQAAWAAPRSPDADADLVAAYGESAAALRTAFGQPGVLEKLVTVPFGTVPGMVALHLRLTELLVHGWDLAQATGQKPEFPADLAEQELAFTVGALPNVSRERSPFSPPQPVPDDAPALTRLVALLGRAAPTSA
jgi:uncharacterized protein (TIGR03086 family)